MTNSKFVIYQVFTRLFGNDKDNCVRNGSIKENGCGKFADFTPLALKKIKEKGVTHIWYTGVLEHASKTEYPGLPKTHMAVVKGNAGSPYAIKDYYDVSPDLAVNVQDRMGEFEQLVVRTHEAGMKVIIDFVPNHVSRQYQSDSNPTGVSDFGKNDDVTKNFSPYNNFYYIPDTALEGHFDMFGGESLPYREFPAKVTGNDCFHQYPSVNDWYETVKLNYGVDYLNGHRTCFDPVPDTWNKMYDILVFWASKGIDGFRCDMAEMVPVEFWEWAIAKVKEKYPEIIFIAEVYNPALYDLYINKGGFDYLYDKVGLYDMLRSVVSYGRSASDISYIWQSLNGLQKKMLNFLENHDEQRIASDYFADNPFKAVPALVVSALMNTNPFMFYFGQEFGERGMDEEGFSGLDGRTTIFDYWSVDTVRRWRNHGKYDGKALTTQEKNLSAIYRKILTLALKEKTVREGHFFDLTYANVNKSGYDSNRVYSFLRGTLKELLIVIVNFDSVDREVLLKLPVHAFDFFGLKENTCCEAKELLSGDIVNLKLSSCEDLAQIVPACGARILKLKR